MPSAILVLASPTFPYCSSWSHRVLLISTSVTEIGETTSFFWRSPMKIESWLIYAPIANPSFVLDCAYITYFLFLKSKIQVNHCHMALVWIRSRVIRLLALSKSRKPATTCVWRLGRDVHDFRTSLSWLTPSCNYTATFSRKFYIKWAYRYYHSVGVCSFLEQGRWSGHQCLIKISTLATMPPSNLAISILIPGTLPPRLFSGLNNPNLVLARICKGLWAS